MSFFRILLLAVAFTVFGCSSNNDAPVSNDESSVAQGGETALSNTEANRKSLDVLSRSYTAVQNVWTGFNPLDHPAIVVFRDSDKKLRSVYAIEFPNNQLLGDTEAVDAMSAPYSIAFVAKPSDILKEKIDRVQNFEFEADIGGISSYILAVTDGEPGIALDSFDFGQYFIHEMFHRYQIKKFNAPQANQDTSDYPFTVENIEMVLLEERALTAALEANTDDERQIAARHFAALRVARRSQSSRVDLDDSQETYEGSARFIEHKMAGNDTTVFNNETSFAKNLLPQPDDNFDRVRDHFGFGRFYSSGAAIIELINRLDVANYQLRIENGAYAASVLIDHLMLSGGSEQLVADARATYGRTGELLGTATRLADIAATELTEMPVVGSEQEGDIITLTPEQEACFRELGYEPYASVEIPQDVVNQCIEE